MPHGEDLISPFEHIFKRKPDLSKLMPIGCVCYAFVPPEKRTKLEDTGIKCRLLGNGDVFETEEINGYKLLTEAGIIIYSDNVTFPKELQMERLDDSFYSLEEDKMVDDLWVPYESQSESDDTYFLNRFRRILFSKRR
jgi:hypothetical protein